MAWSQLELLIKEEQRNGNPIANIIHKLQLDSQRVTLLLSTAQTTAADAESDSGSEEESDEDGDEDEEEEQNRKNKKKGKQEKEELDSENVLVDIDVGESAYANARAYYDQKRTTAEKKEKTKQAGE